MTSLLSIADRLRPYRVTRGRHEDPWDPARRWPHARPAIRTFPVAVSPLATSVLPAATGKYMSILPSSYGVVGSDSEEAGNPERLPAPTSTERVPL